MIPTPPVADFLAAHPAFAVLPAPYFESRRSDRAYLDLDLNPRAFIGSNVPWRVELEGGGETTVLARGVNGCCRAFMPVAGQTFDVVLYREGEDGPAARFPLYAHPERFTTQYTAGPYTHQASRAWGEDGAAIVLIQERYPARFDAMRHPVLYVGGDFNYQHVEGLVRYFRTHGVDAWGYKPEYDRDADEPMDALARHEQPALKAFLDLEPAPHLVGLCVGGLYVRALEHDLPHAFTSLTTIGTPHQGSKLAAFYNHTPVVPALHRWLTGDAHAHRYKDASDAVQAFNARVGTHPRVPSRWVVLDDGGHTPDPRYDLTDFALKAWRDPGLTPSEVHTDGLILSAGQALGAPFTVWNTDHAGMINDGLASTYFDAYRAHHQLLRTLEPGGTP